MAEPVSVTAWIDFLDPWSWVAMTRLERVAAHYGDRVVLEWRPFMREPKKRTRELEEWRKATADWLEPAAAEPGLQFSVWATSNPPPTHSAPALAAALVAEDEDPDRAPAYRQALFRAHFAENRTLSDGTTLIALARAVGIDEDAFAMGLRGRYQYYVKRVIEAHNAGVERGVKATPGVVIGDEFLVRGVATEEQYRDLVDQVLAARGDVPAAEAPAEVEDEPAEGAAAKDESAKDASPPDGPGKDATATDESGPGEPAAVPEAPGGGEAEAAPPDEERGGAGSATEKRAAKKPAKKAPAKKKRPAKKSGGKRSSAKKAPAKKSGGRKAPAKKAPASDASGPHAAPAAAPDANG